METETCNDCGKIASVCKGSSTATIFDFDAMEPSHDHFRCLACTEKHGCAPSNARPSNGDISQYGYILTEDNY